MQPFTKNVTTTGMFHFKVARSKWVKAGDVILFLWGCGMMVYTMYVNINSWVHPQASSNTPSACSSS